MLIQWLWNLIPKSKTLDFIQKGKSSLNVQFIKSSNISLTSNFKKIMNQKLLFSYKQTVETISLKTKENLKKKRDASKNKENQDTNESQDLSRFQRLIWTESIPFPLLITDYLLIFIENIKYELVLILIRCVINMLFSNQTCLIWK